MNLTRIAAALTGLAVVAIAPTAASAGSAYVETVQETVMFSEPSIGPCDGSPGTLTVEADATIHTTATNSSYNDKVTLRGQFLFDPDDAALSSVSGHFVDRFSVNVNFGQLKDARERLMTRAVGVDEDGNRFPIVVTTVTYFGADGSIDVRVDDVRCGT